MSSWCHNCQKKGSRGLPRRRLCGCASVHEGTASPARTLSVGNRRSLSLFFSGSNESSLARSLPLTPPKAVRQCALSPPCLSPPPTWSVILWKREKGAREYTNEVCGMGGAGGRGAAARDDRRLGLPSENGAGACGGVGATGRAAASAARGTCRPSLPFGSGTPRSLGVSAAQMRSSWRTSRSLRSPLSPLGSLRSPRVSLGSD